MKKPAGRDHIKRMARVLALCLLLFGLATQLSSAAAGPVSGVHDVASTQRMSDCSDCPEETSMGGAHCKTTAPCGSMLAASGAQATARVFDPQGRDLTVDFDRGPSASTRPTPLLEPPRHLV